MTLLEKIQITLFQMFSAVACNPEWWAVQFAPVFISAIS
jgi:hypothetical protein